MYLLLVAIIIILLYWLGTRTHDHWEKKGVPYVKPIPFFGTHFRNIFQLVSFSDIIFDFYKKYPNERFLGVYLTHKPGLIIRDPELVQHVLVTDFHYFYNRGVNIHRTVFEPLMKNLFTVDGDTWKLLRQRLTPAFTSGKLKAMFPLIVEKAERLQEIAMVAAKTGNEIDMRELIARYTTDFIGSCGFGIESDSLNDENSKFRQLGRRIFTVTKRDAIVIAMKTLMTETFKDMHFFAPEIEHNTVALVKSIMSQRNYKHSGRNDFIDLLLELKAKGKIVGESVEKRNPDGTPKIVELELDDVLMAAQVFIFFAAGFETSSSTSSFTLHQLAFHPDEQKKCQDEIDEVLKRYGGKLCYDAIKEMKYLEMAFKESMRLYPPLGTLMRTVTKDYRIPGTDIVLDESTPILIPIHALQTDEKYFEEPFKFKPERFHPDNAQNIKKHVYLPFGEGQRACIGERLGLMQSLAGLAAVLSKFSVKPSKSTLRYPITDPTSTITQTIKGGIPLALVARHKN